jgi:hypothetical protein
MDGLYCQKRGRITIRDTELYISIYTIGTAFSRVSQTKFEYFMYYIHVL